jgi:putative protease
MFRVADFNRVTMNRMKRKFELLAPGGDIDAIKAAIAAGADAVYCGLNRFNARNRAANLNFEDLNGVLNLAHENSCKVFLTLNIIIVENEIPALVSLLNKLINTKIDGIIVQDLGVLYILSKYFKGLEIHASTQMTTHNEGQIEFLSKLSAARVNLSRELSIHEIKDLALVGRKNNVLTEVFIHGSYCVSFSGICYISSVHGGNSGNRGRCSQPCRDQYLTTPAGKNFPLNLKDNSAYFDIRELSEAGVDSLKIEGRIKKFDYVYTVVKCWKKHLQIFYDQNRLDHDNGDLYKVFNRSFSNAYLQGDIDKNMFIDNPRDNSIKRLSELTACSTDMQREQEQIKLYDEKEEIVTHVKSIIQRLDASKLPLHLSISGQPDTPLKVTVKTPSTAFIVLSEINLVHAGQCTMDQKEETQPTHADGGMSSSKNAPSTDRQLNRDSLMKRLGALNNSKYFIEYLDLEQLQNDLFLPFRELTSIKKRILSILNDSKEIIDPVDVPYLKNSHKLKSKPDLAVLISSEKDVHLVGQTSVRIFFQLPNCLQDKYAELVDLFLNNKELVPWFPSILIGKAYSAANDFLQQVQPKIIVTNNTGIAYKAYKKGIAWIAGPYLNIVNSFSLLCLKENFNCQGSFISNEINKYQIKGITCPDDFKLYYSIYHPILLLSSRQCLLSSVIGCEKSAIDERCLQDCNRLSSITNLKGNRLYIEKTKGNYHCIYDAAHYLNTDIVTDLPESFSSFLIDLRDVKTETRIQIDKCEAIKLFENLLAGNPDAKSRLRQMIHPSTNAQYTKGI